jgi:putative transcriptional regulator
MSGKNNCEAFSRTKRRECFCVLTAITVLSPGDADGHTFSTKSYHVRKNIDDLVQSMEEMVAIENDTMQPAAVHRHPLPDVKALPETTDLKQEEFAKAVGVSPSLVQSWEQKRRIPSGSALKILLMLEHNPAMIHVLLAL